MLFIQQSIDLIETTKAQSLLVSMYGRDQLAAQKSRYQSLLKKYAEHYGDGQVRLFSAPGRSEIGGNHTDHNYGNVLAASINLDTIAAAVATDNGVITIISEGYEGRTVIDLQDLEVKSGEGGTAALIRGIAAGFVAKGFAVGGFTAYITSNVLSASGLSSSASFEMLVCTILNSFYNDGLLDAVTISKIGQYAENKYWNKPSGLLDQMACAYGGLIAIDFENPEKPIIRPINYNFSEQEYSLVIVNTGGNHADLTEDYAAVPNEMRAVANLLGASVCRQVTQEDIYQNLSAIRRQAGDRAVLRALHFFAENNRVDEQVKALQNNDFDYFLSLITESGNSSWKWLQNCYRDSDSHEQSITVALAITESYLKSIGKGACRVHGGGFAGVILAIVPRESENEYTALINRTLGTSTFVIQIREQGAICLNDLM